MTVRRVRYGKIERLTERLLEDAGISGPSVDIRVLVARDGIEIRSGNLGCISGLLARGGAKVTIGVNSKHAAVRRRFTVAHEYGHFFLHEGLHAHADESFRVNYRNQDSASASNVEEIEANFFAACLLMPRKFLDAENAQDLLDDNDGVSRLAELFDVSQHAMSLRLVNLYGRYSPF